MTSPVETLFNELRDTKGEDYVHFIVGGISINLLARMTAKDEDDEFLVDWHKNLLRFLMFVGSKLDIPWEEADQLDYIRTINHIIELEQESFDANSTTD